MKNNKIEKGRVVWTEYSKFIYFLNLFIYLILFSIFSLSAFVVKTNVERVGVMGVAVICLLIFFFSLRVRYLCLISTGLWTGNAISGMWTGLFKFSQKDTFLAWGEIKNISLMNKRISAGSLLWPAKFAITKTKDGKLYESLVKDIPGFVQALKKLNKDYLLDEKTMEKYK
jgi:hypothetical protein